VPLHRRQFLLGPRPLRVRDDWVTIELSPGVHLSHCPALPVVRRGSRVLLGIAVQSDPARADPVDELESPRDGEELSDAWAGRWLLLDDDRVIVDAGGMLSCYYRHVNGELWASSSVAVLRELEPELPLPPPELVFERGLDWYPGPGTGVDGIRLLLVTQALRLDGAILPRRVVPDAPTHDYKELLDFLESRFLTEARNLARAYDDIWIPLSGGGDSRLILGTFTRAGIDVSAYTFILPRIPRGDVELPPKLAATVGAKHVLVQPEDEDHALLELFDAHTARHVVDISRFSFATHQWDKVPGKLEVSGGAMNVGQTPWRELPPTLPPTPEETAEVFLDLKPSVRPDSILEWAEWVHATNDPSVDWRDRLSNEQRIGSWMAAVMLGMDLNPIDRVHLGNSRDVYAATLALPEYTRFHIAYREHLLRRLAPELLRWPINPADSRSEQVLGRLRRELGLYREHAGLIPYARSRIRRLGARRALRNLD
jgi:hypothetical protein